MNSYVRNRFTIRNESFVKVEDVSLLSVTHLIGGRDGGTEFIKLGWSGL